MRLGLRKRLALRLFSDLYAGRVAEHTLQTLFWEMTLRCNLQCRHCGSDCRADASAKDMPLADFLRVLDEEITPNIDPRQVLIIFSGGEVLVRDDLELAGREVSRRGYRWGMVTNGMALTASRLDSLLEAGLASISVSLDGFAETHNHIRCNSLSFDRALHAIDCIVARQQPQPFAYDVITCVTPPLVPRLEEFCRMLVEHGVRAWRIFSIFPAGRAAGNDGLALSPEEFRSVLDFIRRTRKDGKIDLSYACEGFLGGYEAEVRDDFYQCAAGVSAASVRVDGAISGCTSVRGNYAQGNIYKDRFWDVWQNRFQKFRNREWMRRDECGDCRMFRYCMGGGMHLRDDDGRLMYCHYRKLHSK
ncbi:MAG: TIGR04133 family radical SAM/SPASM protein [Alistipes sp.]|nr:TIGR04133 family radical SAM/SPASM protein [Alistipes sp.]